MSFFEGGEKMTVISLEVLTVGAILAFTIVECISMSWKSESLDK